jgi:hypothetical protein
MLAVVKMMLTAVAKQLAALALVLLFNVANAWGQTGASPSRTECKQWDDAFLTVFNWTFWGTIGVTCILGLLAGSLGRILWPATAPRLRIIVINFLWLLLVTLGVAAGPWIVGLGHYWFGGVDPRYLDCTTVQFNAGGLFEGIIGSGVAAVANWPLMIAAFFIASFLGTAVALIISELANRKILGVPARVKGEA